MIANVININKKYSEDNFELPDSFEIFGYSFTRKDDDVYGVSGEQRLSIIRLGGSFGDSRMPRPFELLDDILIIGSLLTGRNWFREELNNIEYPQRLLSNINSFKSLFFKNPQKLFSIIELCLNKMSDQKWQQKYENGFHLKMLLNHSNIFHDEAKFLSMMVIWEWLYTHIEGKESFDLQKIIQKVLIDSFGKHSVPKKNIFYVLRNQLAHSGRLPIDREYAEVWMENLSHEDGDDLHNSSIKRYLSFFDELTRIVVFKTLDIHLDKDPLPDGIKTFNIKDYLDLFLKSGKII